MHFRCLLLIALLSSNPFIVQILHLHYSFFNVDTPVTDSLCDCIMTLSPHSGHQSLKKCH